MESSETSLVIRLIPPTVYIFSNVKVNATLTVPIATNIEGGAFDEADLLVRLHTGTIITTPASQSLGVSLLSIAPTDDDPTTTFTPAAALATFTTPGTALTYPFATILSAAAATGNPFGGFLGASITAMQSNPVALLVAVLSLDLVLKGGDPAHLRTPRGSYMGYRL